MRLGVSPEYPEYPEYPGVSPEYPWMELNDGQLKKIRDYWHMSF